MEKRRYEKKSGEKEKEEVGVLFVAHLKKREEEWRKGERGGGGSGVLFVAHLSVAMHELNLIPWTFFFST